MFASRSGMQGAGDRTLQALGRWEEPKMIRGYVHLSQEHLREAVENSWKIPLRISLHLPGKPEEV